MAQAARTARVVVMDWDETITKRDTTALVAQTAYRCKSGLTDFSHYTKIYMDVYNMYLAKWLERNNLEQETEFQRGLKEVEMALISAIERDGVFKGVTRADFAESANAVEIQPGFVEFVKKIQNESPMYILSVNWSRTLIEAALQRAGVTGITVLANELEFHGNVSTGHFGSDMDIRTGCDKIVELRKIKEKHGLSVIYVGDSSGDVLPIIEADTGVVIEGGRATKYIEALGYTVGNTENKTGIVPGIYGASWKQLLHLW